MLAAYTGKVYKTVEILSSMQPKFFQINDNYNGAVSLSRPLKLLAMCILLKLQRMAKYDGTQFEVLVLDRD